MMRALHRYYPGIELVSFGYGIGIIRVSLQVQTSDSREERLGSYC